VVLALLLLLICSRGINLPGVTTQNTRVETILRRDYEAGERALQQGDLATARNYFLHVLQVAPQDVGSRVNLGVIAMRQKNWPLALRYFQQAEGLAPQVTGIRLNIGLARYRQGEYAEAIPAFESVVRDQPDSTQARRLLGLCYLFEERYAEAAKALEPLWPASNRDLSYLYSLAVAAGNAGRHDLEQRSLARLLEVGQNSPLVHLLVGKAYLAREDYDQALSELRVAVKADPKLPLLHYTLGVVERRKGDLEKALSEFREDAAIEPDVAYNYDQLGTVSYLLRQNRAAEAYFREALKRDRKLGTSWFGLAKIYKQEKQYSRALAALGEAGSIDANSASVHYLRAQILGETGHKGEAEAEMAVVRHLKIANVDKIEREVSGATYRDPQLASEPK
jgi:tetratricopeptide (TPR) repeat protein